MDRKVLEKNHIFLYDKPNAARLVPNHVAYLRGTLLDFDCTLAARYSLDNDEQLDGYDWDFAWKQLDTSNAERTAVGEQSEMLREKRKSAKRLIADGDRENEWKKYYREQFLEPLEKATQAADSDGRRVSRTKYYYDAFEGWDLPSAEVYGGQLNKCYRMPERSWNLFAKGKKFRRKTSGLTEPKPDYVAYFPIYDFNKGGRIQTSDRWDWPNSAKKGLVKNFLRSTLEHLATHGLEPSPAGIFKEHRRAKIEMSDFLCYPWLVVEHKKDNVSMDKKTFCYCQAANAAQGVLKMHEILAQYAEDKTDATHIPPITTMTTVGRDVKAWIAYVEPGVKDYEMACIWKGDITLVMDIIKLEVILDNLHTWAMRELRLWISQYLDLWLLRHPLRSHAISGSGVESSGLEDQADESAMTIYAQYDDNKSEEARETSEEELLRVVIKDLLSSHHEVLMSGLKAVLETSFESWTPGSRPRQTVTASSTQTDLDADWTYNKLIADGRLGAESGKSSERQSETNHSMQSGILQKAEARRRGPRRVTSSGWIQTSWGVSQQPAGWDVKYDSPKVFPFDPRFWSDPGLLTDDIVEIQPETWSPIIWVKSTSTQADYDISLRWDLYTLPTKGEKIEPYSLTPLTPEVNESEWRLESMLHRSRTPRSPKMETSSHEQQPETTQNQVASFKSQSGTDSPLSNTQRADKRPPEATTVAADQPPQKDLFDFDVACMRAGVVPETHTSSFPQWPMQGASISENRSLPLRLKLPDEESLWEDIVECETDAAAVKVQVEPKPVARALRRRKGRAIQRKQKLRQKH